MRCYALALSVACILGATPARGETCRDLGLRFWKAVANADFSTMSKCYAPEVILMAGSELLKKEYGLNPGGDGSCNKKLRRDALLGGYKALIAKVGAVRWKGIMGAIPAGNISFLSQANAPRGLKGLKPGDVLMCVKTGPGDDQLVFVIRRGRAGSWMISMEATDF